MKTAFILTTLLVFVHAVQGAGSCRGLVSCCIARRADCNVCFKGEDQKGCLAIVEQLYRRSPYQFGTMNSKYEDILSKLVAELEEATPIERSMYCFGFAQRFFVPNPSLDIGSEIVVQSDGIGSVLRMELESIVDNVNFTVTSEVIYANLPTPLAAKSLDVPLVTDIPMPKDDPDLDEEPMLGLVHFPADRRNTANLVRRLKNSLPISSKQTIWSSKWIHNKSVLEAARRLTSYDNWAHFMEPNPWKFRLVRKNGRSFTIGINFLKKHARKS